MKQLVRVSRLPVSARVVLQTFVCLAIVFSPFAAQGRQPAVIWGKVTDTQRQPVVAATITLPALNESALSDGEGRYRLVVRRIVRAGEQVVIRVSREGFEHVSRPVRLAPGVQVKMDFRLVSLK